jgi:hypothetical protein
VLAAALSRLSAVLGEVQRSRAPAPHHHALTSRDKVRLTVVQHIRDTVLHCALGTLGHTHLSQMRSSRVLVNTVLSEEYREREVQDRGPWETCEGFLGMRVGVE